MNNDNITLLRKPIDDREQQVKAQEQQLQHAKLTIAELRAELGYWKIVAEGFGQ